MVYPYSGISLCLKKEGVPVTCYMMILEDIMLSEISQSQKDKYRMIPLIPRVVKFTETENRMVVTRDWGGGGMGS